MPGWAAHPADALSGNVPGSTALLLKCQSPIEGAAAHEELSTSLSVNISKENATCEKSNYFHNSFWLMLRCVKCMQVGISSPPRVDEVCVAIYEFCIVQIVLPHNVQTIIFLSFC